MITPAPAISSSCRSTRASGTAPTVHRLEPVRLYPLYHFQLALDAGLNAYAAPFGFLEAGAREYAGALPLEGGGFRSIIGRNSCTRKKEDALGLPSTIIDIYSGK